MRRPTLHHMSIISYTTICIGMVAGGTLGYRLGKTPGEQLWACIGFASVGGAVGVIAYRHVVRRVSRLLCALAPKK